MTDKIIVRTRRLHYSEIEKIVAEFIRTGDSAKAAKDIGCTRSTVYAYAKKLTERGSLIDKRAFGNNRRYGAPTVKEVE